MRRKLKRTEQIEDKKKNFLRYNKEMNSKIISDVWESESETSDFEDEDELSEISDFEDEDELSEERSAGWNNPTLETTNEENNSDGWESDSEFGADLREHDGSLNDFEEEFEEAQHGEEEFEEEIHVDITNEERVLISCETIKEL